VSAAFGRGSQADEVQSKNGIGWYVAVAALVAASCVRQITPGGDRAHRESAASGSFDLLQSHVPKIALDDVSGHRFRLTERKRVCKLAPRRSAAPIAVIRRPIAPVSARRPGACVENRRSANTNSATRQQLTDTSPLGAGPDRPRFVRRCGS
jgi:hypothetical protein